MTYHNPTHKPACSSRISHHMESGGRHAHSILLKSAAAVLLLLLATAFFCGAAAAATNIYDEAALREAVSVPNFDVKLCADIKLTNFRMAGKDNSLVIPNTGIQNHQGTIDLNGHTLLYAGDPSTVKGDNNGAVIILKPGTTLTVKDTSEAKTGKITGGTGTHPLMNYGESYLFGGGVYISDSAHLILESGSISENCINDPSKIDAAGAGVYADGYGTFEMKGGIISNNYASAKNGYGAGVHIRRGSFTMTRGTISGNIASSSNSVGGGVYIWGSARFEMTGGVISGNSANRGGGVYVNSGANFYVKGTVSIMNNARDDVALIDGHFRTIPKGMLHLTDDLNGYVLVAPEDRYRGPSFGTASSGLSPQTERGIINEMNWKYATVVDEDRKLVWGDNPSSLTLLTLNWGDGDKIGHVVIPQGGTWVDITPISKSGSTLTGWYPSVEGGTIPLIDVNGYLAKGMTSYTNEYGEWTYTGDTLTLYAGWNQDGTTLTLDGNGGSPSQTVKVKYDSTTVDYVEPQRSDSGTLITYTFRGWFLDQDCTTLLINTDKTLKKDVTVDGTRYTDENGKWIYGKTTYDKTTLTLYAGWSADGTQLTLDGQGGEPATQIVSVAKGAKEVGGITLSVIDGYACTGWYIGETGQTTGSPIKLINRDGTLVISDATQEYVTESEGWKYNKTTLSLKADWVTDVTYHNGTESTLISYPVGHKVDIPKAPASDGSFFGWRVGSPTGPFIFFYQEESGYQYLNPSPYYNYEGGTCYWASKAEKLDLYAAILEGEGEGQGSVRFSVTYFANGADSGRVPKETEWYAPGDNVTVCGNTGALEKYGYTFKGWTDGVNIYNKGNKITIGEDNITLGAVWEVKQYTIKFISGYDESSDKYIIHKKITQLYGTPVTAPTHPTLDGYTFIDWIWWEPGVVSGTKWVRGVPKTMPGMDITCYADWEVIKKEKTVESGKTGVDFGDDAKAYSPTGKEVKVSKVSDLAENTTVTFLGDTDTPAPNNTITGFSKPTVLAKFEVNISEGADTTDTKIVITAELTGNQKPEHVYLRHYTEDAWDGEHIKSEPEGSLDPETGMYTFTFKPTSFSPFALTYETPVKSTSSSRDQGSSVWLTATPTPTPTVEATPEPTLQQPTASPVKTPTQPPASPAPVAGIIAGLGAAGIIAVMRRK